MSLSESSTVEAVVIEILPNLMFRVRTSKGSEILVHASAQTKQLTTRLLPGSKVTVEVSPYNRGRGRIVSLPTTGET